MLYPTVLICLVVLVLSSCDKASTETSDRVHAFYYGWYGNPETDGQYAHWNHSILPHGPDPRYLNAGSYPGGEDIGANFYPELGTYSSNDPETIEKHMQMFVQAGIGVLAFSWWGPDSFEEKSIPLYLDLANQYGLKIAFHIEPFFQSADEFLDLLEYINQQYGSHPAYYQFNGKPMFYVYDSYRLPASEWAILLKPEGGKSIRGTQLDANMIGIWVIRPMRDFFIESGFDGFYTYSASDQTYWASKPENWAEMAAFASQHDLLFIPSVGPGYIDTRIRPWNTNSTADRQNGEYYQQQFENAIEVNPQVISITSFNEWHEGTQIEPAVPKSIKGFTYQDYGSDQDPAVYLQLTRKWVNTFLKTSKNNSDE